jgi:hypothetical protein
MEAVEISLPFAITKIFILTIEARLFLYPSLWE